MRTKVMFLLAEHGQPMEENIKDYPAPVMKKLYEWKFNKKSTESRERLLKAYLSAPVPKKDSEWSMAEECRLKELLTQDMYTKDTAIGVQLKQTAKALANNVHDLDSESAAELM